MGRLATWTSLILLAASASGCATCCSPYDEAYGFSGGRWPRADLCHGRVGSAFAPAGAADGEVIIEGGADDLQAPPAPLQPQDASLPSIKKSTDWSGDLMSEPAADSAPE